VALVPLLICGSQDMHYSLIANPIANPVASQVYTLYSVDVNGCLDTDYVSIFIAPNAIANAGPDIEVYPGDVINLYAQGNCSYYTWAPSTFLNSTTISNPVASSISNSIQYVVTATTEFNCTTTDTITLNYNSISNISVPNAFSPGNGTGPNDELKVLHNGTASIEYFRIFNRWGQMIFESTNIEKGWNGKFNDAPQPIGTYIYSVRAKDNTGKTLDKTGNFTLIR
jgi:gliding motility-associated-like protein